ncbi:MAG: hypothetical protein OER85_07610 [Gammaproteobacteria bacterium]|nr:hypothetical protein [Gammaproteobacteria bacterium]
MAVCLSNCRARVIGAFAPLLLFVLPGCGGSGGGVDLAGGQGPDPVVVDIPIAYVKRPVPVDDQGNVEPSDARELITFNIGADLFVRERASPSAIERNITEAETQGLGDIRDLEVSFDGTRIIFAMRAQFIEGADEEDQPKWNIWEYDRDADSLTRVIASDITAEAGHDVAPHYLPDGRIIFSSTRQRQSSAILLDEGKPQFSALDEDRDEFAFVLHVMNEDGSDIHQVSFNQSHDLDPTVMSDGRIAFARWDHMGGNNAIDVFTMNPDGTGLELLYGVNSHDTGTGGATIQFLQPREMPEGGLVAIIRPFTVDNFGGDIITIDTPNYIENAQPTVTNQGVLSGPAQAAAVINDVRTDGTISPGGVFSDVYPLWDGTDRVFVSWSQCRLVELSNQLPVIVPCTTQRLADPNAQPAQPLYGIWIYDRGDDTQLPVLTPEEGFMYTDVVAAQSRTPPPVIFDKETTGELDPNLVAEGVGVLNIRSVYDIDGMDQAVPDIPGLADPAQTTAVERPARFLRIVKAVSLPDDEVRDFANTAFGRSAAQGMREIIGYAPIEPDGSVVVKVPANVALAISVLNESGQRFTARHQNWLQVRPGEELRCIGCHEPGNGVSHGRAEAFDSAYPGAINAGQPFPNTDSAIFADVGETMAEARARISCATDCSAITPSVDVIYDDVWTDEAAAGRPKDVSFSYLYADLLTATAPVSDACQTSWTPACRIVINYEMHIHPLWETPRLAADGITDITCTSCHNTVDAMAVQQVPAGQLDLTGGPSNEQADHFMSYRELLFPDNEQELIMGALQDSAVQIGIDPAMSVAGALASGQFFSRFDAGSTHADYLSDAELKMIAEWLDIGGQYFNNPFDAPIN